jgi:hypothetical protein
VTATRQPSPRALLAACALPLVALAVWFGVIDPSPLGEGRCASCGLEGWAIAAHLAAAVWLGGVVALASALRRGAGPGPVTISALSAAAVFVLASLAFRPLFTPLATVALVASFVLVPAVAIWWLVVTFAWRRPPASGRELERRWDMTLASAWISLALLLPAVYAWVWADRVEWLVF